MNNPILKQTVQGSFFKRFDKDSKIEDEILSKDPGYPVYDKTESGNYKYIPCTVLQIIAISETRFLAEIIIHE